MKTRKNKSRKNKSRKNKKSRKTKIKGGASNAMEVMTMQLLKESMDREPRPAGLQEGDILYRYREVRGRISYVPVRANKITLDASESRKGIKLCIRRNIYGGYLYKPVDRYEKHEVEHYP